MLKDNGGIVRVKQGVWQNPKGTVQVRMTPGDLDPRNPDRGAHAHVEYVNSKGEVVEDYHCYYP